MVLLPISAQEVLRSQHHSCVSFSGFWYITELISRFYDSLRTFKARPGFAPKYISDLIRQTVSSKGSACHPKIKTEDQRWPLTFLSVLPTSSWTSTRRSDGTLSSFKNTISSIYFYRMYYLIFPTSKYCFYFFSARIPHRTLLFFYLSLYPFIPLLCMDISILIDVSFESSFPIKNQIHKSQWCWSTI